MHQIIAAATAGSSFLSSQLGQFLQTACQVLAFPIGLYFVWVIIRHGMRQRHRDVLLSVVFGGLILAVLTDLSIIQAMISFFTSLGTAIINFFSSL